MPRDISPFETRKRTHRDIVKLREQKRIDEVSAIDCELRIIDCLLCDLESRRTRAGKTAAAPPVELGFQLLCATDEIGYIEAEQVVAFDHIWTAVLDEGRESLECVSLGFFDVVSIDNDQFFPAGVVRERDAHDVIFVAGLIDSGYREHFDLHSFQFFERQIFEQSAPCGGEIVLYRIGEGEEIAPRILESVA